MKKRTRGTPIPLIVEDHPVNYDGYPFITLIQYRDQLLLSVVDNTNNKTVNAYILDLCGPERVNEEHFVEIASHWWENHKDRFPISFEFSRLGLTQNISRIYRSFNIEYVSRVIGPLPYFEMSEVSSVRRRKRKPVPTGMKIHTKVHQLY